MGQIYLHSSIRLHGMVLKQAQGQLCCYMKTSTSTRLLFLNYHKKLRHIQQSKQVDTLSFQILIIVLLRIQYSAALSQYWDYSR
jgi:hypothetical protein